MKYTRKSLVARLGIGAETLRYYENIGFIPAPERQKNGYRVYTEEDAAMIDHLLEGKKYGFTLREIKKIMQMFENNSLTKDDLLNFLDKKIKDSENRISKIREQISSLEELKSILPGRLTDLKK